MKLPLPQPQLLLATVAATSFSCPLFTLSLHWSTVAQLKCSVEMGRRKRKRRKDEQKDKLLNCAKEKEGLMGA